MKMQRVRPMDSLQGFMNSFKQFEKKLDKLQADVSYHGNTLSELRTLVAGLSSSTSKLEDPKRPQRKTIGLQWEPNRLRRPNAIQPLPTKIKAKSFQGQKYGLAKPSVDLPFRAPKKVSLPAVVKHHRPRKAEAPRKTTSFRPANTTDKMRSKYRK